MEKLKLFLRQYYLLVIIALCFIIASIAIVSMQTKTNDLEAQLTVKNKMIDSLSNSGRVSELERALYECEQRTAMKNIYRSPAK